MKKENQSKCSNVDQASKDKDKCYSIAMNHWGNKDYVNAEKWAIRALRAGSRNLAPELMANIARSTRSKSTAITLASYYWEQEQVDKALLWARIAKEYGSKELADKLIAEITAHIDAVEIHYEVGRFSK